MPVTTTGGFAADGRAEAPRPRPSGQELAHAGNSNLARATDIDTAVDKAK